jgi:hypothetical protein
MPRLSHTVPAGRHPATQRIAFHSSPCFARPMQINENERNGQEHPSAPENPRPRMRARTVLRASTVATLILTVTALAGLVAPATAMASAEGCTAFGGFRFKGVSSSYVCISVTGKGRHVDRVQASVTAVKPGGVQNIVLRITFFDVHGKQAEQHLSGLRSGTRGTGFDNDRKGQAETFTIHPDKDYPTGRVCASFTENGVPRPGACETIKP